MSLPRVPEEHRADVGAYVAMKERYGIEILMLDGDVPAIEVVGINLEHDLGGTIDRIVRLPGRDLPVIFDLKSGAGAIRYGQVDIGAQTATYAGFSHWWHGGTLRELPPLDQELALVAWMPAGAGTCELYAVDLAAGRRIIEACMEARECRGLQPITPYEPAERPILAADVAWLGPQIKAIRAVPEAGQMLARMWPAGVPRKPAEITSFDQVDAIVDVLRHVQAEHRMPFADERPLVKALVIEQVPTPEPPAPRSDPRAEPIEWATAGHGVLAVLDDEAVQRACARVALADDRRMDELAFDRLASVVAAVTAVDGVVVLAYTADGPEVVVADGALDQLARVHGTKAAALKAAKDVARRHNLVIPKSLALVAANPLYAALAAAAISPATQQGAEQ